MSVSPTGKRAYWKARRRLSVGRYRCQVCDKIVTLDGGVMGWGPDGYGWAHRECSKSHRGASHDDDR